MTPRAAWMAPAALVVAVLSLALNGALLLRLRHPERLALPAVQRVADRLASSDATITYTVRIPVGTPLHFDVPFDQQYTVRVNTTLPVDTRIAVPIRGPLGTFNTTIPVKTDIPIRTNLPVRIRDTFRVRTETRTEYAVPLEIRLRDLPLTEITEALKQ